MQKIKKVAPGYDCSRDSKFCNSSVEHSFLFKLIRYKKRKTYQET